MGNYLATLRRLASTCKFGDFLDYALRDQFICGMLKEATQKVLLTKSDLTLSKAVFVAQEMEAAALKSIELHAESNQYSTSLVMAVSAPAAAASRSHPCGRCVRGNHDPGACHYRTTTCHRYGKVGHIVPVCHSKASGKPSRLPTKKTKWLSATTEPTPLPEQNMTEEVDVTEPHPETEPAAITPFFATLNVKPDTRPKSLSHGPSPLHFERKWRRGWSPRECLKRCPTVSGLHWW